MALTSLCQYLIDTLCCSRHCASLMSQQNFRSHSEVTDLFPYSAPLYLKYLQWHPASAAWKPSGSKTPSPYRLLNLQSAPIFRIFSVRFCAAACAPSLLVTSEIVSRRSSPPAPLFLQNLMDLLLYGTCSLVSHFWSNGIFFLI